jgi:hypothetical protein
LVLGGLVIAGAVVVIAFALGSEHTDSSARQAVYDEIATAPPRPNADPVEGTMAPPQRVLQPTQNTVAAAVAAQPSMTASALAAECRRYSVDRRWDALARCADQLKPLDPKHAAELATQAAEEARSAPRIAGVEAALGDKNLKQAKAELDQVWTGSVESTRLKHAYDIAETQATDELAAQLERIRSPSCEDYNELLAKERTVNPPHVIAEATRRIPCVAPSRCNADALSEKALARFGTNHLTESLALFEAAYACKPTPALLQKAFVIACNLRDVAKARSYWKRLSPALRTQALSPCVRNAITEATLNAP